MNGQAGRNDKIHSNVPAVNELNRYRQVHVPPSRVEAMRNFNALPGLIMTGVHFFPRNDSRFKQCLPLTR